MNSGKSLCGSYRFFQPNRFLLFISKLSKGEFLLKIKKNKLAKLSNKEILSLTEKLIFKNDLPETMKNSNKLVMKKSEFESYLQSTGDRRSALKHIVSIGPNVMAKYAIYELNGVTVIIVRNPITVKVKLPYKVVDDSGRVTAIRSKTISFRKVPVNTFNTNDAFEDDY